MTNKKQPKKKEVAPEEMEQMINEAEAMKRLEAKAELNNELDTLNYLYGDYRVLLAPYTEKDDDGKPIKETEQVQIYSPNYWDAEQEGPRFMMGTEIDALIFGNISFKGRASKAAKQREENAREIIKAFCAVEFFLNWKTFRIKATAHANMIPTAQKETVLDADGQPTKNLIWHYSDAAKSFIETGLEERFQFEKDAFNVRKRWPDVFNTNSPTDFYKGLWEHLKAHKATKADTLKECFEMAEAAADYAKAQSRFSTIVQNNTTNKLANICAKDVQYTSDFTAGIIQNAGDPDFMARIEKYTPQKKLSPSTLQLLDFFICEAKAQGFKTPALTLSLAEYMAARGISHAPTARERVAADLEILAGLSISDKTKLKGKTESFVSVSICDRAQYKSGKILFVFGATFFEMLQRSMVSPYPKKLFELDLKHYPYAYHLGRKIAMDYNMNLGRDNREGIISVKTLLDVCHGLPTYDDVIKNHNRAIDRYIIAPFMKNLDHLAPDITWHFCHKNGAKLTDNETEWLDYNTFIGLNVAYKIKEWPNEDERRQAIKEERRQDEKRKAKAIERAKQKRADKEAEKKISNTGEKKK